MQASVECCLLASRCCGGSGGSSGGVGAKIKAATALTAEHDGGSADEGLGTRAGRLVAVLGLVGTTAVHAHADEADRDRDVEKEERDK